ncbi:hypothetical protein DD606_24910 [Enterobacter cloacae complex sp. GF14B]|nr:hypothetical protein DD606_24910 [Enterobacter cloacae complex sp. GF14B]
MSAYGGYNVPITLASVEEIGEDADLEAAGMVPDEPRTATLYGIHAEDLRNEAEDISLNGELYIDIRSFVELCENERETS